MRRHGVLGLVGLLTLAMTWASGQASVAPPVRFEPNVGQTGRFADYVARGDGFALALARDRAVVMLGDMAGSRLRLRLRGASGTARPRAERPQRSVSNYFVGASPIRWHANVANYAAVRYADVYPGIDWVLHGDARTLEYDFVIAPHADPRRIELSIDGAQRLALDANGDLAADTGRRTLHQRRPVAYQMIAGTRRYVEAHFVRRGRRVSFAVSEYDRNRELVIDPVLDYATYLGGSGGTNFDPDAATGIAVDASGAAYVAGATISADFPLAAPLQSVNLGYNTFVAKFDAAGELVYSTYLGGSQSTSTAAAIAVDASGSAYIVGSTNANDFPTAHALQTVNNSAATFGGTNAFVVKLDPAGSSLVYATYLGGAGVDQAAAVAVDAGGRAYVAGSATSPNFPVVNALQPTKRSLPTAIGNANAFVAVLDADGGALVYSTYLGGSGNANATGDYAAAIAVDSSGNAYVAGQTCSTDFPVVAAFQSRNNVTTPNAYYTAFVAKLNAAGSALVYSTYLGGNDTSAARALAVDGNGNAYVVGDTVATDYPLLDPFQSTSAVTTGVPVAFLTKINATGNGLVYSTYLGGTTGASARAVAVNSAGDAFVAGATLSGDFPMANPLQASNNGLTLKTTNAFVTVFNALGGSLFFSTYLGGSGYDGSPAGVVEANAIIGDAANAIAVGDGHFVYVAGFTGSKDFPTLAAYQASNRSFAAGAGGYNAFVARIDLGAIPIDPAPPNGVGGSGGGAIGWMALLALGCCVMLRLSQRKPA